MINNSKVKIIINTNDQEKFFETLKKIYDLSSLYDIFMGIDFEFNTKKVALMQILFEIHKKKKKKKLYYIIYPPLLHNHIIDFLKVNILSNINILKILHGSESLDMPYIIHELYNNEINNIINFFQSMVDTRYLCEYINLRDKNKNICSIYELLVNANVISNEEKQKLDENEDNMGPIYKIIIDINNLTPELITYSIHDVVYLVDLYLTLKNDIIKNNPKDYFILCDAVRFTFMERRYISNVINDIITLINKMNNYFYYINKNKIFVKKNFIETHNKCIKEFIDVNISLFNILNINYLKTYLINLFRTITYIIILKYFNVKESNTKSIDYNLNNEYTNIIDILKFMEFNYLVDVLNEYYDFVDIYLQP